MLGLMEPEEESQYKNLLRIYNYHDCFVAHCPGSNCIVGLLGLENHNGHKNIMNKIGVILYQCFIGHCLFLEVQ
jgi:hypothetical protein